MGDTTKEGGTTDPMMMAWFGLHGMGCGTHWNIQPWKSGLRSLLTARVEMVRTVRAAETCCFGKRKGTGWKEWCTLIASSLLLLIAKPALDSWSCTCFCYLKLTAPIVWAQPDNNLIADIQISVTGQPEISFSAVFKTLLEIVYWKFSGLWRIKHVL